VGREKGGFAYDVLEEGESIVVQKCGTHRLKENQNQNRNSFFNSTAIKRKKTRHSFSSSYVMKGNTGIASFADPRKSSLTTTTFFL
jgi:hypothetical protein